MSTQAVQTLSPPSRFGWPWPAPGRLPAYAAFSAVSFLCYIMGRVSPGGAAGLLLLMVGMGSCGWAWLLARALFDPAPKDVRWPRIVASLIALTGALSVVVPASGVLARIVENAYSLGGSTALLLTFIAPFQGRRDDLARAELWFRLVFLSVYAGLVAVSILGLQAADEGRHDDLIKAGCAAVGLLAAMAAVGFRLRHPLVAALGTASRRVPTEADRRLAERIVRLLRDEGLDAEPDLRIGDLAARLGQPEYRVSRSISAALGFANFNRLINHHRIERARRMLVETDPQRSILEIAFDCGFGSVGPFNRAFKASTGMTPRAFRRIGRVSVKADDLPGSDPRGAEAVTGGVRARAAFPPPAVRSTGLRGT